jgi:iodotyrosine deiodinase
MTDARFVPLSSHVEYPPAEMATRASAIYADLDRRRSVRSFADRAVPRSVIEDCIRAAGTAPSGAHQQPWHFVVVGDPEIKHRIRLAAEAEEREFYTHRAPADWLQALAPIGTDDDKSFLDVASYLIVVFAQSYGVREDGTKVKHYYVQESVGIATGLLIAALHHAGLAMLTHTPSPMGFLNEILRRPANERPYVNLVVGYPAEGVTVPDLRRKPLDSIATFL